MLKTRSFYFAGNDNIHMFLRSKRSLNHEQKIGFVLLLFFGIIGLGFGVLKIRNTLYKPFALTNNIPNTIKTLAQDVSHLQFRDTDKDGLNDFEELYVYKTSPYVADTDSDGIDDKTEISKGENPNCAKGRPCSVTLSYSATSTSGTILTSVPDPGPAPTDITAMLNDPTQLRAALVSAGVDQTLLSGLDDTQLLKIVQDLMSPSGTAKYGDTKQ